MFYILEKVYKDFILIILKIMETEVTGLVSLTPEKATQAILATAIVIASAASGDAGPIFYNLANSIELNTVQNSRLEEFIRFVWGSLNPDNVITEENVTNITQGLEAAIQPL